MADQSGRKADVESEGRGAAWGLAAALVLLALVLVVAVARREPPEPKSKDAPAAEASGARAREVLSDLLGDGSPHPVGSPANAAVRERLVARLRGLGLEPTVEGGLECGGRSGNCAQVENVMARLDGTQPSGDILVMAHYDSVPAGAGAADDMTGVAAILEAVRALKAGPPLKNNVLLLFDEGEEPGLLGARWFADHSSSASGVKVIVNLEARGTSGPSLMFETSSDNAWTVSRYASAAPHPVTSSVFAAIYDLMPNDTDLSVFKRRDLPVPGLNFAFIGEPTHYHTSLDRLDNVSPASIQHHADNALAAVRSLGDADLAHPPRGRLVFFDVLGAAVVRWPMGWTLWIGLLGLVLILLVTVLAVRRGTATTGGVLLGFASFLAIVVFALLGAFGLGTVARGGFPTPWVAHPLPVLATFWLVALAAVGIVAALLGRRAGAMGLWGGVWLGWVVLGLLLTTVFPAPGVSYLFMVPALVAAVAGLALFGPRGVGSTSGALAVILPALAAGVLWFPIVVPLYDGLGSTALVPVAVLLSILFATLAPLFVTAPSWMRRGLPIAALVGAIICLGITVAMPPYSASSPRAQNIILQEDADAGKARWIIDGAGPLPASYRQAAAFPNQAEPCFPWSPPQVRCSAAPAADASLPAPELAVLADSVEGGQRHLRLHLSSPRGARKAVLVIPEAARLVAVEVDGVPRPMSPGQPVMAFAGWVQQTLLTLPAQGSDLTIVLGATEPQDWYIYDQTGGLPAAGEALVKARPATAAPIHNGDQTIVSRKVRV